MQASLVKICQSLESRPDLAKALAADCTEKSSVLLASFDPSISFLRMSQQSLVEDLNPSFPTWPRWGLMRDGAVFVHPMSALRISETDGSYWATPAASDGQRGGTITENMTGQSLPQMVNTPTRWPTPTARIHKGGGKQMTRKDGKSRMDMLDWAVEKDGGRLNPTWVEHLMGFPIEFTVSKDWVTPKSRCKQQQPTDSLEVSK
jgi:hypothetical protein